MSEPVKRGEPLPYPLTAEEQQDAADASLGAALRAALESVPGGSVTVDQWDATARHIGPFVTAISWDGNDVNTAELNALRAALVRSTREGAA